jgi:hypothetical protein
MADCIARLQPLSLFDGSVWRAHQRAKREIPMPPRSYIIAVVVLGALVAVSFFLTLGFSMTIWSWLFAIAACILGVAGAFKVSDGLRAPRWIGVALASPGLVWAVGNLREWIGQPIPASSMRYDVVAAYVAVLAAGAGALRLMEMMSRSHAALRVGYALLAVTLLLIGVVQIAFAMGWTFISNPLYTIPSRAVFVASTFVKYGAFIGAAVLITMRRDVERWTAAVISLISAYMLYKSVYSIVLLRSLDLGQGLMFLLQPVAMFVGGAAVWHMGSVLREQSLPERSARPSSS